MQTVSYHHHNPFTTFGSSIEWRVDIEAMNLWPALLGQLTAPEPEIRKGVAWVCGTAVQNNPKAQTAVSGSTWKIMGPFHNWHRRYSLFHTKDWMLFWISWKRNKINKSRASSFTLFPVSWNTVLLPLTLSSKRMVSQFSVISSNLLMVSVVMMMDGWFIGNIGLTLDADHFFQIQPCYARLFSCSTRWWLTMPSLVKHYWKPTFGNIWTTYLTSTLRMRIWQKR